MFIVLSGYQAHCDHCDDEVYGVARVPENILAHINAHEGEHPGHTMTVTPVGAEPPPEQAGPAVASARPTPTPLSERT